MDQHKTRGITLLEIIISLSVSVVLFGFGLPVAGDLLKTNRVSGQVNALSGALSVARSEAIKQNQHVVICKSQDGLSCSRTERWDSGWIVYSDSNQNRKRENEENLILVQDKIQSGLQINYHGFGSKNYVTYRPTGDTRTNGTFTLCYPEAPNRSRALILTKSGRVRLSKTQDDGSPLICS